MDNNFNQNGQFGGWTSSPYGYGTEMYNEYIIKKAQKDEKKQELKKIGRKCGLAVILYVVISYGFSFLLMLISWGFPSVSKLYLETTATLAFDIVITFFSILVPFFIIHLTMKKNKTANILPFGTTYNREFAISLVMVFIPIMVMSALAINSISAVIQDFLGIEFTSAVGDIKLNGFKEIFLGVISVAVVPAIVEETVIRGIVMQPLRKFGDKFAIITSAVFFACMHGNMVQIPYTVIGGLLLGYLAVATGSLWPSVILHFVNNLYSVIVIATSDNLGENASVLAVVLMLICFTVIGVIGLIKLIKLKYKVTLSEDSKLLTMSEKTSSFVKNGPMIVAIVMITVITISNVNF